MNKKEQIPLWKYYLSYLKEVHIESAPSDLNPHLYVSLNRGRYQLSTANAIYSYDDLYENFDKAFAKLNFGRFRGKKALILGFGLGSIPLILTQKYQQDFDYIGIEADEAVIYLASKYTLTAIDAPIDLICSDAYAYVAQTIDKYDLICMDVFLDDTIPSIFETTAYLDLLQSLLTENGLILYNRLALTDKDKATSTNFYQTIFHKTFPNGCSLDVGGNHILFSDRNFL